jgi:hypothetical protein
MERWRDGRISHYTRKWGTEGFNKQSFFSRYLSVSATKASIILVQQDNAPFNNKTAGIMLPASTGSIYL